MRRGTMIAAVAGLLAAPLAAGAVAAAAPAQAATTVNMEAVVKAAQWDPYKSDQSLTPGAGPSVEAVEQALAAKNLLDDSYVDGHFGTTTVTAYAAYQRSLGYSGLGASGLPGAGSLTKLGEGRFTVSNAVSPGDRTTVDGEPVNTRTKSMLAEAEKISGEDLRLTQGSYSPGNGASAGTHDGGGVVDISISGLGSVDDTVKALRQVGFAAWHRTPAQGFDHHIHAVAISDTDMSPQAQQQVGAYYLGRNGLAGNGADDGPQVTKVTWEEYQRG